MKHMHRGVVKKPNDGARLIITATAGIIFGYLIGVNFPYVALTKINLPSSIHSSSEETMIGDQSKAFQRNFSESLGSVNMPVTPQIYVPTNPRGAESLPPGIVVPETDLYLRRLWGEPGGPRFSIPSRVKDKLYDKIYPFFDINQWAMSIRFLVGWDQRDNIDASVKKFSEDFQILLFHYDGRTTEWDRYEWSKDALHISVKRQTKWWYAKRFMHPDIVAAYDYIFIWDEDLGVEHFNGDRYIQLIKKHGLEISQPGLEPNNGLTWQMTKRRGDKEVHKDTEEKPGWCSDPHLPPCAAFVEIMAPVFSREAWRCVWYMIQNDLVHGWGLDFALRRCVDVSNLYKEPLKWKRNMLCNKFNSRKKEYQEDPPHEKIGVVDSQWIVHQVIPSLGSQGQVVKGRYGWQGVKDRCKSEWALFQDRLANADKVYFKETRGLNSGW